LNNESKKPSQEINKASGRRPQLKTWISYIGDYERLLYGTDWPLANIGNYIEFIKKIIPERHWEKVFFHNANRIYKLNIPRHIS